MESSQVWLQNILSIAIKKNKEISQNPFLFAATTSASILVAYLCTVRYHRYKNLNTIRKMHPNPDAILHDAEAARSIYGIVFGKEFPYLTRLSLELALFKTFTVPTISKILAGTGEFSRDVTSVIRRAEDTELLIRELTENHGRIQNQLNENPETSKKDIKAQAQRSVDAIKRLNELHSKYPILNGDYLYTLTLFVFEPISWVNRFEWRELDEREVNAIYKVWYDIGKNMKIEGIPDTVEGLLKFKEEYGSSHIEYHPANWKVGGPTVRLLLTQFPSFLRDAVYPIAMRFLPSVLDSRDAEAFNLPHKENKFLTALTNAGLRARALFIRYFLLPRDAFYLRTPFYPNEHGKFVPNHFNYSPSPYCKEGYKIEEFGPTKILKKNNIDHPPISDLSDIMPSKCPMMH